MGKLFKFYASYCTELEETPKNFYTCFPASTLIKDIFQNIRPEKMIALPFKQNKESVSVELMEEINLFQNSNQSTNPKYHIY